MKIDHQKILYAGLILLIIGLLSKVKILMIIGALLFVFSMFKKKKEKESETV